MSHLQTLSVSCICTIISKYDLLGFLRSPQKTHNRRPMRYDRHFTNDNFNFLKGCILIGISLKVVPNGPVANKSALGQIMSYHKLATSHYLNHCWWHVCVTGPPWIHRMVRDGHHPATKRSWSLNHMKCPMKQHVSSYMLNTFPSIYCQTCLHPIIV